MNKSKHTPSPWIIENNDILGASGGIAHVASIFCDHAANARLIAAAPDLLEACKMMVDDYDSNEDSESITYAKLAISKAEFHF